IRHRTLRYRDFGNRQSVTTIMCRIAARPVELMEQYRRGQRQAGNITRRWKREHSMQQLFHRRHPPVQKLQSRPKRSRQAGYCSILHSLPVSSTPIIPVILVIMRRLANITHITITIPMDITSSLPRRPSVRPCDPTQSLGRSLAHSLVHSPGPRLLPRLPLLATVTPPPHLLSIPDPSPRPLTLPVQCSLRPQKFLSNSLCHRPLFYLLHQSSKLPANRESNPHHRTCLIRPHRAFPHLHSSSLRNHRP